MSITKPSKHVANVPPQHVALLCFLEDKYKFIYTVDFIFNILDEGSKGIGDVVYECIGNPVGSHADVVLELLDPTADILGMRRWSEMELMNSVRIHNSSSYTSNAPTVCLP